MPTNMNRRSVLKKLSLLGASSFLLPSVLSAANDYQSSGPIYIPPGEGNKARIGEMEVVFKFDKSQTSGHLGASETIIQPGELGAPPHLHKNIDEICRVLEGSVFIMTGDTVTEVKAGGWHLRPKGLVHTFWNSGSVPAKTIDIYVPGGHEDYLKDLASLFENGNRPKPDDFKRLEKQHDIKYRFDLLPGIMEKYKVHL